MLTIEKTITSLEVAETTGKRHDHVIRDINTIIKHLGAQGTEIIPNSEGVKF